MTKAEEECATRILDRLVKLGALIVGTKKIQPDNRVNAIIIRLPNGNCHSVEFGQNYLSQMKWLGETVGVATD